jgi:riboflavin synthase
VFTGIIETIGTVQSIQRGEGSTRIVVEAPGVTEGVRVGDSVAVNGACLTVTQLDPRCLGFDAVRETLERTSLGSLAEGSEVNLERALRADARLDGHLVQGHVDGTGTVQALERAGDDVRLLLRCDPAFAELLVEKGSVAIEGVSLTVVGVEEQGFDVVLIPHTLERTTLGRLAPGDRVNLEADVLGKYVKRYLERVMGASAVRPRGGEPRP